MENSSNFKKLRCVDTLFSEEDRQHMQDNNIQFAALGIDPSINSTGLTLIYVNSGNVTAITNIITPHTYTDVNSNIYTYNKVAETKSEVSTKEHYKMLNFSKICMSIENLLYSLQSELMISSIQSFAIEGISMNAQFKRASSNIYDLSALNYAIRATIFSLTGCKAIYIPPRSLKLKTTGDGSASKQAMYEKFCADTNQDIAFKNVQKDKPHLADLADSYAAAKEAMYSYYINTYKK